VPAFQQADDLIPAIGYIRVSLAREEMISPELQRASIESWARISGRRIVKWVIDLDATGRNFKRKIMKAISYIEDGTAKEIAVWKYSRFGRNRHGNAVNLERVERAGGQLESSTEQIDARSAVGRFQRGMLFEVAAFESDRAGEQWKETHNWRRANGLPSAGKPRFGYIWHPRKITNPDGSVTIQQERYEHNPSTAPIVAELYQRYVDGVGFDTLAKELNTAGIFTLRGSKWWGESLRTYMDSGFPAGYLRVHSPKCHCDPYLTACPNHDLVKVQPAPGTDPAIPPIISDDLWRAYAARRAQIKATAPRARKVTTPFSLLSRCSLCNGAATRTTVGQYAYLHCNSRRRRGADFCTGVWISLKLAEAQLLAWLGEIAAGIEDAAEGEVAPLSPLAAGREKAPRVDELTKRREKLQRAVAKHMRTYALSEDDDPDGVLEKEYRSTLEDLREEKAEVEKQLVAVEAEQADQQARVDARAAAMPVIATLLEEWDTLAPENLNALLRQVVRCIKVKPGKLIEPVPAWE
jgi:DNA invertase Pin-like site-specific DNA recombinase